MTPTLPLNRNANPKGVLLPHRSGRTVLLTLACGLALTSCNSASAATQALPSAGAAPNAQCTPTFGGDAYPCSQAELDALTATAARYNAAIDLYKRYTVHAESLLAAHQPADRELRSMMVDPFASEVVSTLAANVSAPTQSRGNHAFAWARPADLADGMSVLAVSFCTEPGTFDVTSGGTTLPRTTFREDVFFIEESGQLKISSNKSTEVLAC